MPIRHLALLILLAGAAQAAEVQPVPRQGDEPPSCALEVTNRFGERLVLELDAERNLAVVVMGAGLAEYQGRLRVSFWIGDHRTVERAYAMDPRSFMFLPDAAATLARLSEGPARLQVVTNQDRYEFRLPDAPDAARSLVECVEEAARPRPA